MSAIKTAISAEKQQAIGANLQFMYHTAVAMYDLAAKAEDAANISNSLWAIQELARGQARDLERWAELLQGTELGFYATQFESEFQEEEEQPSGGRRAAA